VLSARRLLYVSWTGRNVRDNSERPPSVLVSQFRDYLAAGWTGDVLHARTTEHPLQPFSRRYFEGGALFTHAREWRAAHDGGEAAEVFTPVDIDTDTPLAVANLVGFLRQPVKEFFRRRLQVVFTDGDAVPEDEETFSLDALQEYQLVDELIADPGAGDVAATLATRAEALQRAGRLPIGALGARRQAELVSNVAPMLERWAEVRAAYPRPAPKVPVHHEHRGVVLEDWLDGLVTDGDRTVWLELSPGRVLSRKGIRAERLLSAWVRALVAGASRVPVGGVLVARDATVVVEPVPPDEARALLDELIDVWREGMAQPLPVAAKTALAFVADPARAAAVYDGGRLPGEGSEDCLARLWPEFEALVADGRFEALAAQLYGPVARWIESAVKVTPHGRDDGEEDGDE